MKAGAQPTPGAELRKFVPYEMDNILERRAKEYKQHQLRLNWIFLHLAHSPVNTTPCLALQTQGRGLTTNKREVYKKAGLHLIQELSRSCQTGEKDVVIITSFALTQSCLQVSLSVKSGVLSVEDLLDGDQVEGQGQSELTISSSSLTQLNDLLSRVTYTSTIYHIRTSDLGKGYLNRKHT
ncbi:hypothetical protein cypCar_00044256 [Cyprinus carpio]|nr:hypothetical protein cypCar_00044256 [Cyprinus carpio]